MVADPALGLAAPDLYLVTILLLASAIVEFSREDCSRSPDLCAPSGTSEARATPTSGG